MWSARLRLGDATGFRTFACHTASESILFTVKGGGGGRGVCVCVCVWQVEGSTLSQQALFFSPLRLPEGSPRLSIVRLVSEPVWHRGRQVIGWIALYDVRYDNTFTFYTEWRGGCSSVCNSPQTLAPPPPCSPALPLLEIFLFFFIWLENLLSPRGAVIIPSSTGITRQGDVDGCLLPSAGELSPRTTPTMTRSLWHALLQLPSLDTSLLPPLPARGPPPGRMLGYAAVIHLLQLALENVSHTHTLALAHTHIHTPRG